MYETHFGLRCRPFRATPDSAVYYPATSHEHALARLLQGIADDESMLLLSGEPGTGKTVLCHCLIERLGPEVTTSFVTNSHVHGRAGLLQAILYDLSLPYEGRGEQELRLALTDHLLTNYAEGRRAVLLMDEAQHLDADLLEELRLLTNLEARDGKAFQVVLCAQPTILPLLRRSELGAVSQRVAVRAQVEPLPVQEAADYLLHLVRQAGGRAEDLLSGEALEVLARGTHGVPRLLNQAAHHAFALACTAGADNVDAEAAVEALGQLGLTVEETDEKPMPFTIVGRDETVEEIAEPAGPVLLLEDEESVTLSIGNSVNDVSEPSRRVFTSPRRPA